MEFAVSRNALLNALQHTRCAITKHPNHAFECFVLTFDEEKIMTVRASNGELWMTETVLLNDVKAETRPIAIYYNDTLRSIKALDEQPLRFEVFDYQLVVHHSVGQFRLPLCNTAEEFLHYACPQPDADAPDGHRIEYEAPGLKSILSRCNFAMAKDELRPVMNGVYINLTKDFSDYVSSDGHKLIRIRKRPVCCDAIATEAAVILPSNVVKTLLRVLPATGDVEIEYQEELVKKPSHGKEYQERKPQCRITVDDYLTLSFNPVEGRYPAYWQVIPEAHRLQMTIDRRQLIKSVDRLTIFANDSSYLMTMIIDNDTVHLNTEDKDFELSGEEQLPCECKVLGDGEVLSDDKPSLKIGFKAPSLSATLKALSTEEVALYFTDSSRAVIIKPVPQPDTEEITMLLMPMFTND